MELQLAIDTLSKFRNVLGSVEALDKALSVAASLEDAVKALEMRRASLVQDLQTLEGAISDGEKQVSAAKHEAERLVAANLAYDEKSHRDFEAANSKREKLAIDEHETRVKVRAAEIDELAAKIRDLKSEKASLEAAVANLTEKVKALKAAAAAV